MASTMRDDASARTPGFLSGEEMEQLSRRFQMATDDPRLTPDMRAQAARQLRILRTFQKRENSPTR